MSIDTESVSDVGSSNTVLAVTIALIVLGIGLLGITTWFWRATRPDPEALGPLVAMSDRRFAALGPIEKRRALDGARPVSPATEVAPVVDAEPAEDEPVIEEFENDDESVDDDPVVEFTTHVEDSVADDEPVDDEPVGVDDEPTSAVRPIDPLL